MRQKIGFSRSNEQKTFEEGFKEFLLNCNIKNLSPHTVVFYKNVVRIWYSFSGPEQLISEIDSNMISQYIMFLKSEKNENDVTINTNVRGLRVVLYYFMKLGYLKSFKISNIKCSKEIIETYTDEEMTVLLKKPDMNKCTFNDYRNWVVSSFLLATGCRANTLINIRIKDLDFENQLITYVKTKNRKQQVVPMSNSLGKVLKEYIQHRGAQLGDDYVFVNVFGRKLTSQILSENLRRYNKSRGVLKTGVHRWRHTFAKVWILQGGDVFRLQKILGHSSLDVVKEYIDMFTNDLKKDFNTFNPLEQVKVINKNFMKIDAVK